VRRGQSAIEYLLMIALALVIAAIVITQLIGVKGYAKQGGKLASRGEGQISSELGSMVSSSS